MAKTKPDFTIKPGAAIWRHGRVYKAGNEAELEEAGFPAEQKKRKAKTGQIVYTEPAKAEPAKTEKKAEPNDRSAKSETKPDKK